MAQMRAVLVKNGAGPLENLFLGETTRPRPSAKEVLVKVRTPMIIIIWTSLPLPPNLMFMAPREYQTLCSPLQPDVHMRNLSFYYISIRYFKHHGFVPGSLLYINKLLTLFIHFVL